MAEALTGEAILVATEEVLRRYGPVKATVVGVAKALGVGHGSVYRHFPAKAALREAVTRRWLDAVHEELEAVLGQHVDAAVKLKGWLQALFDKKRRSHTEEPELFATFTVLVKESDTTSDTWWSSSRASSAREWKPWSS